MKLSFKNILIIFLVAMLGGGLGTYGILKLNDLNNQNNKVEEANDNSQQSIVQEVVYKNKEDNNYTEVIESVIDSVVQITTEAEVQNTYSYFFGGSGTSSVTYLGSGVIITEDGYIVTNEHVVSGATDVSVELNNGESYEASIIGYDTKTDLALLKIEAENLSYSKIIDSDQVKLGEEVLAIGNSIGRGISCSNGIISALNREITITDYTMTLLQTNAEINSGNSGGGLYDMNGNLIGIVNAKTMYSSSSTTVEGMGYAIPSNTVKNVIEELLTNGYVKNRPALGVKIYTSTYNQYYQIEGLVISEVVEDSGSYKAGLKAGDIIKSIDGKEVSEFSELSKILDSYQIGDTVKIEVVRNNKTLEFNVTLQETTK